MEKKKKKKNSQYRRSRQLQAANSSAIEMEVLSDLLQDNPSSSFRMCPRHSTGLSLDWATRNVLSPGWDTPQIPGAPAGSDTTTPVGVTWIRVTRECIAPAAIAWEIR